MRAKHRLSSPWAIAANRGRVSQGRVSLHSGFATLQARRCRDSAKAQSRAFTGKAPAAGTANKTAIYCRHVRAWRCAVRRAPARVCCKARARPAPPGALAEMEKGGAGTHTGHGCQAHRLKHYWCVAPGARAHPFQLFSRFAAANLQRCQAGRWLWHSIAVAGHVCANACVCAGVCAGAPATELEQPPLAFRGLMARSRP